MVKAGKALAWLVAGLLAFVAIVGAGGLFAGGFVWDTEDWWASNPIMVISCTLASSLIVYNLVGQDRLREKADNIKEWIAEEGATYAALGVVGYLIGGLW